ncbi:hypothetical protein XccvBFoX4_gp35 [Xanthomonas phage FoX4]|uniref:Uncharacterized protein n=1 Tax=Xanthomonas phage FoX4 TaxID=2723900 RepID=A0A858WJ94_9CAUD|nr:tail assembly protein [Xanthomonas phage FoX4]QJI52989.1 hypothetical protein XccvBFoX4_gp35 [Xanthomonas phage FoX4]
MIEEYVPPLTPNIFWVFKQSSQPYDPPLSPEIIFTFGADDDTGGLDRRKSSFMILLTQ